MTRRSLLRAFIAAPFALLGLKRAAGGNPPEIIGDPNMPIGVWNNGAVITAGQIQTTITPFKNEIELCFDGFAIPPGSVDLSGPPDPAMAELHEIFDPHFIRLATRT